MMMKKFFLLLALLPSLAAAARPAGEKIPTGEISAILSDFRRYDGVEVIRLGQIGTAAVKGVVRAAARSDPDAREALRLIRGIRQVSVMDYEDCAPAVRERIERRIARTLAGSELLLEAKDGNSSVRMFGIVDERTGDLHDFVLHAPDDCALVCLSGTLPAEALGRFIEAR